MSMEDSTVRIDTGELAGVIANGRAIDQASIYGSMAGCANSCQDPLISTAWDKMEE